jgi:ribose 5-phosphate isomerase B
MKIALASDHAASDLREVIRAHLESRGFEPVVYDVTVPRPTDDYPVYADMAAHAVADGECELGILICGTGIGMSLAANKVNGIRAAVCSEPYSAKMARAHNNANILCFGARVVGTELAKMIVDTYLDTAFEGGRHQRRVDMIMKIERDGCLE